MRLKVTLKAKADLDAIWEYVAESSGSTDVAYRALHTLTDRFALFTRFPRIGRLLESAPRADTRVFPAGNHLIFYSIQRGEIRILRIIHSSRDAFAVFANE